ncbi:MULTISPECIES: sensor histidine kinase [Clostridium]|uniref:sensor histidine kinase n=1 Tax=Clostridium TaxID=1485 RepID=UPI00082564B0|nr:MULTISPECIES: HAMP domain-containing sensor histidine kinase [Clostridium]PJI07894.1 sensor histidine kinase [Clostridium sp. CT7]
MKLWEKIFICTLVAFEFFFVPSTMYLINRSFKLNLESEINSGINEQNRFCESMQLYVRLSDKIYIADNKAKINQAINSYMESVTNGEIYFQILDNSNRKIYDDFKKGVSRNESNGNFSKDKVSYEVRDITGKSYLYINKKIYIYNRYYKVSYIKEVSWVYKNYRYLYNILMKLNFFVCIALAVVMIIISKTIVNPINQLIKSTHKISEGNFSERVKITNKDEIGDLAENFNHMADVIEENIKELRENSMDKQNFIDNLSHEIRSPLTSIIGYTDYLITNKSFDEETFNCLNYVYKEGKRLQKMSSKLMDLIMLREEKPKMQVSKIKSVIEEIKNSIVPKLKDKNIELVTSIEDFSLTMDRELIRILISNLVDNAIKASQCGSKIYINSYIESDHIVQIKDKGVGIPKEEIKKIFEPFYMVDKSRDRSNNGVGLGLSLCSQIARIHNIKFDVESELGEGTTIKIRFNSK